MSRLIGRVDAGELGAMGCEVPESVRTQLAKAALNIDVALTGVIAENSEFT